MVPISKEKAYEVLTRYYHHKTEIQHAALREALDRIPPIQMDTVSQELCMDTVNRQAAQDPDVPGMNAGKWIPFKVRPLTEEEKEDHPEWDSMLDCKLPEDGQEILVSLNLTSRGKVCKYVREDIFCKEGCESYLDSGFDLVNEAVAWMPKPEPWEGETNGND